MTVEKLKTFARRVRHLDFTKCTRRSARRSARRRRVGLCSVRKDGHTPSKQRTRGGDGRGSDFEATPRRKPEDGERRRIPSLHGRTQRMPHDPLALGRGTVHRAGSRVRENRRMVLARHVGQVVRHRTSHIQRRIVTETLEQCEDWRWIALEGTQHRRPRQSWTRAFGDEPADMLILDRPPSRAGAPRCDPVPARGMVGWRTRT